MTKVEAITKVMKDNGGLANWATIYNEIENYYPHTHTHTHTHMHTPLPPRMFCMR